MSSAAAPSATRATLPRGLHIDVRSPWTGVLAAALSIAAITALIYPLKTVAPVIAMGVLYLIPVLAVASWWGLALGLGTAVVSGLAFNFFHIPPTGRLTVEHSEQAIALAAYAVSAALAAVVADLAHTRAAEAERRRAEAERAATLAQRLLEERDALQAEVVETEALRRSDVLKTTLLRTVSHDLRTPLTAIIATGHVLRSPTVDAAEREELLDSVVDEATRLARLVDKLLDLSRLQAGAAAPHRDWCSIEDVARTAAERLGDGAPPIVIEIDRSLPLVRADPAQIERVFVNLLENALRHAAGHPVTVRAFSSGPHVIVRVVDQGAGIEPRMLERIFEPFVQGSDRGDHQGSGLGLAIVRGLVEANGGRVWAESLPGQGTAFVVEFPLEEPSR